MGARVPPGDDEGWAMPSPQAALACPRAQANPAAPSANTQGRAVLLGLGGAPGNGWWGELTTCASIQGKLELQGMSPKAVGGCS